MIVILVLLWSALFIVHLRGLLMVCWDYLDDRTEQTKTVNSWYDVLLGKNYVIDTPIIASDRGNSIFCRSVMMGMVGSAACLVWPLILIGYGILFSCRLLRELVRGKKKISVLIKHAHEHKGDEVVEVDIKTETEDIITDPPSCYDEETLKRIRELTEYE